MSLEDFGSYNPAYKPQDMGPSGATGTAPSTGYQYIPGPWDSSTPGAKQSSIAAASTSGGSHVDFSPGAYTGPTSPTIPGAPTFSFPSFQAPTGVNMSNDPGYAFRLQQGENALQNSAAAKGVLNTGGSLEAALNYGQDYASQEYGNVYNRALQSYNANLGTAEARFAPQMAQYNFQGQGALGVVSERFAALRVPAAGGFAG